VLYVPENFVGNFSTEKQFIFLLADCGDVSWPDFQIILGDPNGSLRIEVVSIHHLQVHLLHGVAPDIVEKLKKKHCFVTTVGAAYCDHFGLNKKH
jgi:hypothetical protein